MFTTKELIAGLTCGEDARAEIAARELPKLGAEAFYLLCELLKNQEPDIRWWVVRALSGFETSPELINSLLAALKDESAEVRQAAALALCQRPFPQSLEPLLQALADPDQMTADLASNALIQLGNQATLALLEVLENGSPAAKLGAVHALAEINDPRAIPGLMKANDSSSAILQYWAGVGLEKLGVGMLYLKPD
jgi:HEAT repeat protein